MVDRNGMMILSREACLRHLGRTGVGRVAVTVGALPAIFPINYAMRGEEVVFRTAPGSKLAAAVRDAVVAFEVDYSDRMSHTGWSVMVVGPSREVTDPTELAGTDTLPLMRWARAGGPEFTVCIRGDLMSGRELVNAERDADTDRRPDLPFETCPDCGSDALQMVFDGDKTKVVCAGCVGCWHANQGALQRTAWSRYPGCSLTELCLARQET
jgi:uncharacterized protein